MIEKQSGENSRQNELPTGARDALELEDLSQLSGPSLRTRLSDKIAVATLCVVSLIGSATGKEEVREAVTRILHEELSVASIEPEHKDPYQDHGDSFIDPSTFEFPAGGYSRRKNSKKDETKKA